MMKSVRSADINDVHVFAFNYRAPIGRGFFPPPARRHLLERRLIASADHLQPQCIAAVKEMAHLMKSVGVRTAHEAVADHGHIQRFFLHSLFCFPATKSEFGAYATTLRFNPLAAS